MPRISRARAEAVRARILEAGVTVFERRGFERASISAIAEEAGLSAGSIYTYFESKEELFLAAFGMLVEEEEQALTEAIGTSPLTSYAVELAVDHFARLAAGGDDFRGAGHNVLLHAWATAGHNEALRQMLVRRRAQASLLARTVIEGAVKRGELRSATDAEGLAQAVVSMLDGLFLQRAEQDADFSVEQARRQAHAFIDALFDTAGARGRAKEVEG